MGTTLFTTDTHTHTHGLTHLHNFWLQVVEENKRHMCIYQHVSKAGRPWAWWDFAARCALLRLLLSPDSPTACSRLTAVVGLFAACQKVGF